MSAVFCLHPNIVEERFEVMMPLLKKLVNQFPDGTYTVGGIMGKFARQEWTCWTINKENDLMSDILAIVATTCFKDMAGHPTMQIVFTVGENPADIVENLKEFHTTASEHGLRKIEIIGRAGWTPWLKTLGYDTDLRLYRKTIEPPLVDMTIEGNA